MARAAAAERAELARHRERLVAARASLRDELDRIEASLGEVEDRVALLTRLAPDVDPEPAAEIPGHGGSPTSTPTGTTRQVLRGPAIRREAVRVLLDHPDRPEAVHYRQWYELLTDAGYTVAGKDPLAVFLTQVSRSPVVVRGTQTGVYALDPQAPRRLRGRLSDLHAELRSLASTPEATADLAAIRERRREITAETGRTERALEEAETLLAPADDVQYATA
ncbi:hypothetical protein NBH00_18495 [Paraconexibacter antarcticus]|uniref:HTH HARE-type domain-containing protein n=1 Tax=Paraconexibacter antarcticus TaxID=2949664 RepID=A0ABY5DMW3_9ACTN|nr:hypothetical protein [Paraconexibacter antarcticus]UTI63333.1 hypothetical protein NBH00_18495 [Paraconexibacter antarcticus]